MGEPMNHLGAVRADPPAPGDEPELWELEVHLEGGTYPLRLLFEGEQAVTEALGLIERGITPVYAVSEVSSQPLGPPTRVTLASPYGVLHVKTAAIQAFQVRQAGPAAPAPPPLANFSHQKPENGQKGPRR